VRKGILNTFALAYVDLHRAELTQKYAGVEAFRTTFTVDPSLMSALETQAKTEGVEPDADGMMRSKDLIALRLKALIARDLWDTSAYWQVINADNPVDRSFQRALEVLEDDTFQRLGMSR
jgi:carboxyl-terminal processing protease